MPPNNAPIEEETSMRDDFDTAIAAVESDDDTAVTTETAATDNEQSTAEELRGDAEKAEAKAKAKVEEEAGETAGKVPKASADADKSGADDSGTDGDSSDAAPDAGNVNKAPESWSPAAREAWKDMPDAARQQVMKREREINKFQNEGAQNRKTGEAFQGIADKYAQVFAAEGAPNAITGIEELVKTVATLRMGSKAQKVAKVAGFIEEYGIDIGLLDDHLSGNIKPAADDPMTRMLNERLKPVDDLLAHMTQQQRDAQFQRNQDAINEVATFRDGKEFYDDVKNDMADMVEMAEKRGINMPLQEAYDKACALNPEITKVLTKRTADERLIDAGTSLAAKRDASSSINGRQGGIAVPDTEGMTMRQTIEAGFESQRG